MRPFVERLIHKAKAKDYMGHLYLKQTLFTSAAIAKVKKDIAPRFAYAISHSLLNALKKPSRRFHQS